MVRPGRPVLAGLAVPASPLVAVLVALLTTGCGGSDPPATPPDAIAAQRLRPQCVVADPEGELILNPGALVAPDPGVTLDGVELDEAANLEVVETSVVAFGGNPTARGVILDYPPIKKAGLADSLADWDSRRPLTDLHLTPADGLQAVLVAVRLTDPGVPGHLTGVTLRTDGDPADRAYPQPLLIKPDGEVCSVDDFASPSSPAP